MRDEAETQKQKLNEIVQRRGGPGITEETYGIETDAEVRDNDIIYP